MHFSPSAAGVLAPFVLFKILFSTVGGVASSGAWAQALDAVPISEKKIPALVVLQSSNGLPGRQGKRESLQQLIIAKDRLLLKDPQAQQNYLLKVGTQRPSLLKISEDGTQYQKVEGQLDIQKPRDRMEHNIINNAGKLSAAEYKEAMRKNYLLPGLQRVVKVAISDAPAIRLGEQEYQVKRMVLTENDRVIVDALLTEDLNFETPFFSFYQSLGAFSDEVLKELKKQVGVPLKVQFTVVTSGPTHQITVTVSALEKADVQAKTFEIPPGAKEVVESPFAPCAHCGVQVEKSTGSRMLVNGRTLFFLNRQHKIEYLKKNKTVRKRRERTPRRGPSKSPLDKEEGKK